MKPIGILTGVSAGGKTAIALEYAEKRGRIEIINADSLLIYQGLDIGTAKPTAAELARVPHHVINVRAPDQPYNAAEFLRDVQKAENAIIERGNCPLLVGGTGFYLKALLYGLWDAPGTDTNLRETLGALKSQELYDELYARDQETALRIGVNDRYRLIRAVEILRLSGDTPSAIQSRQSVEPNARYTLWVVDRPQPELEARIDQRTRQMLTDGLLEETQRIRERFGDVRPLAAVGYAQAVAHLDGIRPKGRKLALGEAGLIAEINLGTRQLVKRQRTWFRGEKCAQWFTLDADRAALLEAMDSIYA